MTLSPPPRLDGVGEIDLTHTDPPRVSSGAERATPDGRHVFTANIGTLTVLITTALSCRSIADAFAARKTAASRYMWRRRWKMPRANTSQTPTNPDGQR